MNYEREDLDGVSLEFLLFNIQDLRNYIFNNLKSFFESCKIYKESIIDEESFDEENNVAHEDECTICMEVKKLKNKFQCKHSICIECFHKQLKSKVNLVCCLCRSEVNKEKLSKSEKKIFNNRSKVKTYLLLSSFNLHNLVTESTTNTEEVIIESRNFRRSYGY